MFKSKLKVEWSHFKYALKQTRFKKIGKKQIIFELISNGVAGIITFFSTLVLRHVFVVKGAGNLWGLTAKKDSYLISKNTFEWLNWVMIFVVGLLVFTFVEQIMEKYLEKREDSGS